MKMIDGKGRIFGKINIIDFVVVIFILCLTPMLWFGWKMGQNVEPPEHIAKVWIEKTEYNQLKLRVPLEKYDQMRTRYENIKREYEDIKRKQDSLEAWKGRLLKEHYKLKDFK